MPTIRAMAISNPYPIMLVQDRSPIHIASITNEWLGEYPDKSLINWPSKGCDIIFIENIWGIMKIDLELGPARDYNAIDQSVRDV